VTPYGNIFTALSENAMLSLSAAVRGDACVRTDSSTVYQLLGTAAGGAATLANWRPALGMGGIVAATAAVRTAAAESASDDIDVAIRYQGRKYDPTGAITGTKQEREFPRIPYDAVEHGYVTMPEVVWDTDADGDVIVPEKVLKAWLYQVNDRCDGKRLARLMQRQGLAGQSTGGMSETYIASIGIVGLGDELLCPEAMAIMNRYRVRQGSLL
jgi:hypothetical protein